MSARLPAGAAGPSEPPSSPPSPPHPSPTPTPAPTPTSSSPAAVAGPAASGAPSAAARTEIRLLSYNIRSMRDDRGALARVIRACAPDVVCLQEAPRFMGWRRLAGRLGRATGLVHVTGGAPTCGTMIMSALWPKVEHTEDVPLPYGPGHHRRVLATARLRFGDSATGPVLTVASCHLANNYPNERHAQAGVLLDRITGPGGLAAGGPAVVAGDINDQPSGRAFRRLGGALRDAWAAAPEGGEYTWSATRPQRRIDAVLCTPDIEIVGCGVPWGAPGIDRDDLRAATDHLPLLAVLRLPPRAAGPGGPSPSA
ncbi:endonuclease/exonuclease/phosphatase family protein [Streptomyces sp. YIM 98790]|uniref:endonuclease/exonuclease/phosphatase family protein n=1 Tax=Streptomyces sp. YIM 98790 TaxID=2689077 RepID=UPI00140C4282|nr:endonuclease/exonuclease/phosphatase family protein [Streptomyces sp. YIM 98790]